VHDRFLFQIGFGRGERKKRSVVVVDFDGLLCLYARDAATDSAAAKKAVESGAPARAYSRDAKRCPTIGE